MTIFTVAFNSLVGYDLFSMVKEFSDFGKDHFGIITFLLTALGICGQLLIAYLFNKRAERYKAELQGAGDGLPSQN